MKPFAQLSSLVLALLPALVAGVITPRYFQRAPFTRRDLNVTSVETELGALLSPNATILGPGDPSFANTTVRYSTYAVPDIEVVVVPGIESDVAVTVQYCDENSIEFLAVNRAHGHAYSASTFKGLMIDIGVLQDIQIQPDQKSAWFQGGTYDGLVMDYLWDKGLVATTGSCDCVGMMGPGLGGGHGRNEGLYGLISDNIINLNVVLANGTAIRVNETSHPDLLWGMKGAGHNFGIVTSFELKVHPRLVDTWHYHNYIFTEDKLEQVFEEANKFHHSANGTTPVNMALNFITFEPNTTISETKAVISWSFAYRGPASEAEALLAPINAIPAVYDAQGDVSFPNISVIQGTDLGSGACVNNNSWISATASTIDYNVTAERALYDLYNDYLNTYPELAAASVTHEGYANAAVQGFNPDDSAYPSREYNHLNVINILVPPEYSNLTSVANQWAAEIRDIWNAGQPGVRPYNYVNYANGSEPVPSMYGYEEWRLERLVGLKAAYDPLNRFRFYNPIVQS
ncbi:hypothetical protein QBC46DRAFT_368250 [Diplogelasinospora grovesii]|uniref:FAD-binding PCMH-type domain-containing protein n=1 Tax=Diplogelasinospora grovesii TaxID=303347 RepID=A0AAN6RYY6_9PEZI|nr:hypothetical protein QBC46DRAFT_368250 [Diplogelasinospora grovesii]